MSNFTLKTLYLSCKIEENNFINKHTDYKKKYEIFTLSAYLTLLKLSVYCYITDFGLKLFVPPWNPHMPSTRVQPSRLRTTS